jgi:outer membrane protein assembly factor BamA
MSNKLLLCLSLVLSSGLSAKVAAQGPRTIQTYENRRVGKIEIKVENLPEGSSFDKQTVVAKLSTREGDPFSQYVFDQDLKQLANDYDRIEPQIQVEDGRVDIVLKLLFLKEELEELMILYSKDSQNKKKVIFCTNFTRKSIAL